MKRILPAVACLLIGFSLGWFFCYFGPVAKHQRELLAEYRYVRNAFQMSDAEMAQFGRDYKQFGKDLIRQDELAAGVALAAMKCLENGDVDAAKSTLLRPVGIYYRLYSDKDSDKTLLNRIAAAADDSPSIAAEISRKPD